MSATDKTSRPVGSADAPPFPWVGLIVLAGAVFLSVTSETMPTGLLPDMSASLNVSEPAVGLLVTIFAFTVVATSTPLTALTRRLPRHGMIVGILLLLAISNALTAIAPSYGFVVGSRILGGIAHGLFWAVVGAYSGHLVPKEQIGRAVAITLGGGTLAFVFGVPLATIGGHIFGWRLAFAILAGLMVIGAALVWRFLPAVERDEPAPKREAGEKRRRDATVVPVILVSVIAAVLIVGHYTLYTYIAPFMIQVLGVNPGDVGELLFVYGLAGGVGLVISGSVLGRKPHLGLVLAIIVAGVAVMALTVVAAVPAAAIAALVLWGIAFGTIPPLMQTRLLHTASASFRDTASALYTTAFNVGIGGGALLGAIVYGSLGITGLPWFYAAILAVTLVLVLIADRWSKRRVPAN
jgi:predicted MFS family arabinose efflux permease